LGILWADVGVRIVERAPWEPGGRLEWLQSARWHGDVAGSAGFVRRERNYATTVANSDELAQFAAHHRAFYELLHVQRLDVEAVAPTEGVE
jgi:hypothetical protein